MTTIKMDNGQHVRTQQRPARVCKLKVVQGRATAAGSPSLSTTRCIAHASTKATATAIASETPTSTATTISTASATATATAIKSRGAPQETSTVPMDCGETASTSDYNASSPLSLVVKDDICHFGCNQNIN